MNRKVFVIILCIITILSVGCQPKNEATNNETPKKDTVKNEIIMDMSFDQFALPKKGETIAIIHTTMGDIKVKFFEKEAPRTVENFIKLAEKDYYDGVIFHRVIADFMIQGGDPTGTGSGGESIYGKTFEDEFNVNLRNFRGALSMANCGANTNGSQFFIVQKKELNPEIEAQMKMSDFPAELQKKYIENGGTPWLDNRHTVFGQVFEGMDTVDKIAKVEVDKDAKPLEDVKITDIEIVKY